ncbi:hypothetical protein [uncultured Draconibacterium sp.]|uniref:hypothetical protein n=1 Tax=uncultured Draconibacterium sp. TaxID=1573823 RepID=UPI002AA6BFCA|nr:hypothetical protein [uncultured Draconibacterium sp.]
MKKLHKIATLIFLISSLGLYGQKLETFNLNDLIEISDNYGIDSALNTCRIPIRLLPPELIQQLYKKATHSNSSENIKYLLLEYSSLEKNQVKEKIIRKIQLENTYKNINEINFENYDFIRNILADYLGSECWQVLYYDRNIGILDVGCVYAPKNGHGALYKLELKQDEIILYKINKWIS